MSIVSRPYSKEGEENFDRVFRKDECKTVICARCNYAIKFTPTTTLRSIRCGQCGNMQEVRS